MLFNVGFAPALANLTVTNNIDQNADVEQVFKLRPKTAFNVEKWFNVEDKHINVEKHV